MIMIIDDLIRLTIKLSYCSLVELIQTRDVCFVGASCVVVNN